ncbi:MAG: MBL fold metallo-hydrolase [Opitutaceae bacterium]
MIIRIEDDFEDVLSKAIAGLGIELRELAASSGVDPSAIESLLSGVFNEPAIKAIAPVLFLNAEKLCAMARSKWQPPALNCEGVRLFNTPFPVPGYQEMTVNNYIVWDRQSREGCIFDTGADPFELLNFIKENQLTIRALFLTHTHRDHVAAYERILDSLDVGVVYAPELEPFNSAETIVHQSVVAIGTLSIEARLTNGHSVGGTSYIISGLEKPLAVVGDSLFCLSMGKAPGAYSLALKNNREQILTLPSETILCPGHGPLTTVATELDRNPFF